MNIVQEFYEDFISKKPKLPRLRKKRMDDVIAEAQPNTQTEEVVETPAEPVEQPTEAVVEEPEVAAPAKDPSFNCVPCKGEGLSAVGNLCSSCQGTGKV